MYMKYVNLYIYKNKLCPNCLKKKMGTAHPRLPSGDAPGCEWGVNQFE